MEDTKTKRTLTEEHKGAIRTGRVETTAVRRYLDALQVRGRPGRRVSIEDLQARQTKLTETLETEADPLKALEITQALFNLDDRIAPMQDAPAFDELEQAFIEVARSFSTRKGISYPAWRSVGVPAKVLKQAGVGSKNGAH